MNARSKRMRILLTKGLFRGSAIGDRFREALEFLEQDYGFHHGGNVRRAVEISLGRHPNIDRAEASPDRERKPG